MNRDPFYTSIKSKLAGPLNPELFEQCAVDLLRRNYPVVPVHGGDDAGMDGAIADGKAEAFPLVSTTAKDTTGNLRRNLTTYVQRGGKRRQAVFATSQFLTSRRRDNLQIVAKECDFDLVQIHDGNDFANRLYRDTKWCKELLGLSGDPTPLSAVPCSERPLLNTTVIGRDNDIDWLANTKGDRLLVGQPGSGKTHLLHQFTREGRGLFVISRDRDEIAVGIRDQEPSALIVDDASPSDTVLTDLRHLRETTYAEFDIIATCWPRDKDRIRDVLCLPESQVHSLELLTRADISEVIEATGLRCGVPLMNELVDQAEGRPGLAATLAYLILQGEWEGIISGQRLRSSLLSCLGERALPLLATFALGGEHGLDQDRVAQALELSPLDVWTALRDCRAAGVIRDVGPTRNSVRPPALRYALVKEMFFSGAGSLPVERVLQQIGVTGVDVEVLIGARARGARVSDELIMPRLEHEPPDRWTQYSWIGKSETERVLATHREMVSVIVEPALHYTPKLALRLLLERAVTDNRPLNAYPDAPLRQIHDWIKRARPGSREVIRRRRELLAAVDSWIEAGCDPQTGLRACEYAMCLDYGEVGVLDVQNRATIRSGMVTPDEIRSMRSFWTSILGLYERSRLDCLEPLQSIVRNWAYPSSGRHQVSDEQYHEAREFAGVMLQDVLRLGSGRLDVAHWARQIAGNLRLDVMVPIDDDFSVLYPWSPRDGKGTAISKAQEAAVEQLARRWSQSDPETAAARLAVIENAASKMKNRWPRWSGGVSQYIAQMTEQPLKWSQAFADAGLPGDMIRPMLERAAQLGDVGWEEIFSSCIGKEECTASMLDLVLTLPNPAAPLVDLAMQHVSGHADLVAALFFRGHVPEATAKMLLSHPDAAVAQAAAEGEWYAQPKGHIRDSLVGRWREVVSHCPHGYWLGDVFGQDSELALTWLRAQLPESGLCWSHSEEEALLAAVHSQDLATRITLIRELSPSTGSRFLACALVGDDVPAYEALLANATVSDLHSAPLSGTPDEKWLNKARVALEHYSVCDVVRATSIPLDIAVFWGALSAQWLELQQAFTKLADNPDEQARMLGEAGHKFARQHYERELAAERTNAIYGRP